MIRIPKQYRDLRRHALRRDVLRILAYLLWLTVWYLGAYAYNQNHQTYRPERLMLSWRLAIWMLAAAVSGFFLFRLWKFITDRTCVGTIVKTGLSHTYSSSPDPGAMNGMDYDFRTNTALKIQLDNGKKRRLRFEQKPGFYLYYYEGNRVLRFHGLPYPVNLDPEAKHGYVCSACGTWSKEHAPHCAACHLSLIDPKDLNI